MTRELFTSWEDYQAAVDRLLSSAQHELRIYDHNLSSLRLESPERLEQLKRLCQGNHHGVAIRIGVRSGQAIRQKHPRLLQFLATFGHRVAAQETPAQLAHLRDSMLIADDHSALIRFDQDHARSKLLLAETDEILGYANRFEEIWREGGEVISGTTIGL